MKPTLVVLLSLVMYASSVATASSDKYANDGQKSYKEFRATIKSFPYSTSAERNSHILKNYPSLRVGMTKKQAAALVGDPDYSAPAYGPKGPQEHWLGSNWSYVLLMREDTANDNDARIEIFFGTDGKVRWAAPSGIAGVSGIGKCC